MERTIPIMAVAALALSLTACGNKHEEQKQELRHELRSQFYDKELKKVQAELTVTDSLLQQAEADPDTLNVGKRILLDSLKLEADVQGAKIRYIRKKQEELRSEK